MIFKVGDVVWYLDLTYAPKIKQSRVEHVLGFGVCKLENYSKTIDNDCLFLTKEDLLADIDPPAHNFVVGQTLWYIENDDDPDTLRVERVTVVDVTNQSVTINISSPHVPDFTIYNLDIVFASPREAVLKALALKAWEV